MIRDKPPAAHCDGKVLVEFEQKGTCNDGDCSYKQNESSCLYGCENAECLTGGDTDTDTDTDTETELTWVSITGGTFNMGSTDGFADELPVHSVTVQDFEMLETEVTMAQCGACVTAG